MPLRRLYLTKEKENLRMREFNELFHKYQLDELKPDTLSARVMLARG